MEDNASHFLPSSGDEKGRESVRRRKGRRTDRRAARHLRGLPSALSKWTARLQETIVGPAKEAGAIESPGQQMSAGGMSLPLSRTIGQAYLGAGSSRSLRLAGQSHHRPANSPRAVSGAGPGALQPPPAYLLGSPLSEPF
uniref:Uncharacterized protein n=1 Tax=Rousettus aegyptiacus TaxID=9407 RepID=A0A7J8DHK0_ROUAE|nr:hypothetical protein HJG63_008492 [Rousettus aegyptiacus]